MQLSMFSSAEPPANRSASRDSEKDWMTRVATSCLPLVQLLRDIGPNGWFGRTSLVSSQVEEDKTLQAFWDSSAARKLESPLTVVKTAESSPGTKMLTVLRGEFWTLNTLEFHSGAVASSLSDILETGDAPLRFYLSSIACRGILHRAVKRGKDLPPTLRQALQQVAEGSNEQEKAEGKTL